MELFGTYVIMENEETTLWTIPSPDFVGSVNSPRIIDEASGHWNLRRTVVVVLAICDPIKEALGESVIGLRGSVFQIEDVEEESLYKAIGKYWP